jgi:hypothetical protein
MSDATTPPDPARQRVTAETRAAETMDAYAEHDAPQVPTPEEEAAAERAAEQLDPAVGEAYREYLELAVDQEGEGRI